SLLAVFGVRLGSFVTSVGDVSLDVGLPSLDDAALGRLAAAADADPVRCPDPATSDAMRVAIDEAKVAGETLGGTFVVFALGAPIGLGSHGHWDRKLDGRPAQAVCSIHAVKGAEIGPAFDVARRPGTQVQDPIARADGSLVRTSNFAGGLEAGMTNGQPVIVRAAMKPLSSVRAELVSVDFATGEVADPPYVRSDVCAVPAAAVIGEAMVAWVLADALVERFGADRLDAMLAARDAVAASESAALTERAPAADTPTVAAGRGAVEEEIDG